MHEIWVDKNDFIVWQSQDSSPAAQEGITLQKTTTVNLKSANVNVKMDDSLFTFIPPDKSQRRIPSPACTRSQAKFHISLPLAGATDQQLSGYVTMAMAAEARNGMHGP